METYKKRLKWNIANADTNTFSAMYNYHDRRYTYTFYHLLLIHFVT